MSDHSGKLIHHTVLYIPAQLIPPLVQFATLIAWTHLLDPTGFGIATFVIAAQEFTSLVGITWWSLFLLRFRARFAATGDERFRAMDNLTATFAVVLQVVLTLPMLWMAGAPVDWSIFLSAAGYFISRTVIAHYGTWANSDHLIGAFTAAQFIGSVVGSGLSVAALMVLGPNPSVALGAQAVGVFLGLVPLFNRTNLRLRIGRLDRTIFADAMRYGVPLIVGGIFAWIAGNSIRVIVQWSEGAVALGLLSVGWGLGQRIAVVLAMPFTAATYPLAVRSLESGDRKGALGQVSLNGVLLFALFAPAMAGVALLTPSLVVRLIAAPFRDMTVVILPIAFLVAAIRGLRLHTSEQAMMLLERTRQAMYVAIFEAAANVVCCVIGLRFGGLVGAALGILAGTTVAAVASFAYSFRRLGLPPPPARTLLRIVLATGMMSASLRLMPEPSTLSAIAAMTAIGAAVYGGVIILVLPECRALIGQLAMRFGRTYRADREAPRQLP